MAQWSLFFLVIVLFSFCPKMKKGSANFNYCNVVGFRVWAIMTSDFICHQSPPQLSSLFHRRVREGVEPQANRYEV